MLTVFQISFFIYMTSSSFEKKLPWVVAILGLIACILSVIHASLRAELIELFYVAIFSILFSILILFIISEISKNTDLTKGCFFFIVYMFIYSLLLIWLVLSKGLPEYRAITDFETERAELIFKAISATRNQQSEIILELAKLYMYALDPIERIEHHARYKGAIMLQNLLLEKIEQNKGEKYRDEMFELAEVQFIYVSKKLSKKWYKRAFDAGRLDALERYNQRIRERFKRRTVFNPNISPFEE